jgi:hypothetical protein
LEKYSFAANFNNRGRTIKVLAKVHTGSRKGHVIDGRRVQRTTPMQLACPFAIESCVKSLINLHDSILRCEDSQH